MQGQEAGWQRDEGKGRWSEGTGRCSAEGQVRPGRLGGEAVGGPGLVGPDHPGCAAPCSRSCLSVRSCSHSGRPNVLLQAGHFCLANIMGLVCPPEFIC